MILTDPKKGTYSVRELMQLAFHDGWTSGGNFDDSASAALLAKLEVDFVFRVPPVGPEEADDETAD